MVALGNGLRITAYGTRITAISLSKLVIHDCSFVCLHIGVGLEFWCRSCPERRGSVYAHGRHQDVLCFVS